MENEQREENRRLDEIEQEVEEPGVFWMYLMMFLLFPVGLVMMWTNKRFPLRERLGMTFAFGSYTFFVILVGMFLGATAMDTVHEWKEKNLPGQMEKLNKALNGNGKDVEQNEEKEGASEHVKQDLLVYLNDITPELVKQEAELMSLYDSVMGDNYVDEKTTLQTLRSEVIPQSEAFLRNVETAAVSTPELQQAHQIYIKSSQLKHAAFQDLAIAIETGDKGKVEEKNQKFKESKTLIEAYTNEVYALAGANNLQIGG